MVVVDLYTNPWGSWSPHSLNFMLFTSVWTLLAVAYLVLAPTRFPRAAHKFAIAGVEFLTMLFWFAAFIAVAVLWNDIEWDGHGTFHNCGVAAIVFGAFLWSVRSVPISLITTFLRTTGSLSSPPLCSLLFTFATLLEATPAPHPTWLVCKLSASSHARSSGRSFNDVGRNAQSRLISAWRSPGFFRNTLFPQYYDTSMKVMPTVFALCSLYTCLAELYALC